MHLKHKDTRFLLLTAAIYLPAAYALWGFWGVDAFPALLAITLLPVLTLQLHLYRRERDADAVQLRQVQALVSLYARSSFRRPLPPLTGWAASPSLADTLYTLVQELRPRHVVELGSGASSLVIAYALEANGAGHLTSLDQDAHYGTATAEDLRLHGLENHARVLHAPLRSWKLEGEEWTWYDLDALPDEPIDLLVVDGPHRQLRSLARYPALPLLHDHLSPEAVIVLDDANRPDEQRIVARWMERFAGFRLSHSPSPKGTAILRRTAVVHDATY